MTPSVTIQSMVAHEPGCTTKSTDTNAVVANTAPRALGKKRALGHRIVTTTNHPAKTTVQPRSRYHVPPPATVPRLTITAKIAAATVLKLRTPNTMANAKNGMPTRIPVLDTDRASVKMSSPAGLNQALLARSGSVTGRMDRPGSLSTFYAS
jgi:hypothetical protein